MKSRGENGKLNIENNISKFVSLLIPNIANITILGLNYIVHRISKMYYKVNS